MQTLYGSHHAGRLGNKEHKWSFCVHVHVHVQAATHMSTERQGRWVYYKRSSRASYWSSIMFSSHAVERNYPQSTSSHIISSGSVFFFRWSVPWWCPLFIHPTALMPLWVPVFTSSTLLYSVLVPAFKEGTKSLSRLCTGIIHSHKNNVQLQSLNESLKPMSMAQNMY